MISFFFFFQAEDGIRDLVRSRGLGDVYKRQVMDLDAAQRDLDVGVQKILVEEDLVLETGGPDLLAPVEARVVQPRVLAVSYTHLTLPTSDLV